MFGKATTLLFVCLVSELLHGNGSKRYAEEKKKLFYRLFRPFFFSPTSSWVGANSVRSGLRKEKESVGAGKFHALTMKGGA